MRKYGKPNGHPGHENAKPSPRKLTPSQKKLIAQTEKQISVRQRDGTEQTMSIGDALIQKHIQTAFSGSPHALNQMSNQVRVAEELEVESVQFNIEKGEEYKAYLKVLLEKCIKAARDEGLSDADIQTRANDFYPHPDDVIINDKGYELTGPYDEESLGQYHYVAKIRDAYLKQHFLDERYPRPRSLGEYEKYGDDHIVVAGMIVSEGFLEQRSAYFFALNYNDALPKRFQMTEAEIDWQIMKPDRLTKRELLRECYQTWASLNIDHPRGWLSPTMEQGLFTQCLFTKFIRKVSEVAKSGEHLSDREWLDIVKNEIECVKQEYNT